MDFNQLLSQLNISLSEEQEKQFYTYYELLNKWNEVMNLTGITDYEGVYLKHFYDSLTLYNAYDLTKDISLCDVGSGAGFPAIPIKIAFPNVKVTIVDSLGKRINFLNEVILKLGLKDIVCHHARAEEFALKHRESFDVVTSRALANINIGSELCLPLVKVGGYFLPMMARHDKTSEINKLQGIKILGGQVENLHNFMLPIENSERSIACIKKVALTPKKYPRSFSAIKKAPLM